MTMMQENISSAAAIKAAKKSLKRQESGEMKLKSLAKSVVSKIDEAHPNVSVKQVKAWIQESSKFAVSNNLVSLTKKRKRSASPRDVHEEIQQATSSSKKSKSSSAERDDRKTTSSAPKVPLTMRLRNKTAIVTGAANGIGKAIAEVFVQEGARVALVDMDGKGAEELAQSLRARRVPEESGSHENAAIAITVDVSDEDQVKQCVAQVLEEFGRIDILVNNAAVFRFGHLLPPGSGSGTGTDRDATAENALERVMEVNLHGYAYFIKHVGRAMRDNPLSGDVYENRQNQGTSSIDARGRGSIVNVCSVSAFKAQPEFVPYNCSKGAILQLTRCCAMDFGKLKIRVNAVSPGSIETDGSHNHMSLIGLSLEEGREAFGAACTLGRQGAPEEVARVALFLASADSSFVTGSNIVVDGGDTYH